MSISRKTVNTSKMVEYRQLGNGKLPYGSQIIFSNSGVYLILNLVNNKVYIGSCTKKVRNRIRGHISELRTNKHPNRYLQYSFNKHKIINFKFYMIERCHPNKCIEREQYWIDYYNSFNRDKGYNIAPKAGNCLGMKHTEETKERQSALMKKKKGTPEHREKISMEQKEIWSNIHYRNNMLAKLKESHKAPGFYQKRAASIKKSLNTPESKAKLSNASKNMWNDPNYRAKHSASMNKVFATPEYKLKQSLASKKKWESQEYRNKLTTARVNLWKNKDYKKNIIEIHKKRCNTPEYKAMISERTKQGNKRKEQKYLERYVSSQYWPDWLKELNGIPHNKESK